MKTMLEAAKAAKTEIARLTSEQKNAALHAMADALIAHEADILAANALDMEAAKGTVSDVMLDRLQLTSARIAGMAQGIREVAALPDPVGMVLEEHTRADGLLIQKKAVPMGVIAIIYESRPNVTSDAAALALKSGNVCVRVCMSAEICLLVCASAGGGMPVIIGIGSPITTIGMGVALGFGIFGGLITAHGEYRYQSYQDHTQDQIKASFHGKKASLKDLFQIFILY